MMTSENAPSRRGMVRTMASSRDRSASRASSSAITSVSLLGRRPAAPDPSVPSWASDSARTAVLVRLPLWARAIPPPAALVLKAGWAFSQRDPPVVE
jgi:hypothetical protein